MAWKTNAEAYDLGVALRKARAKTRGSTAAWIDACEQLGVNVSHAYKLTAIVSEFSRDDVTEIGVAKLTNIRRARLPAAELPLVLRMARELTEPALYEWITEKYGKRIPLPVAKRVRANVVVGAREATTSTIRLCVRTAGGRRRMHVWHAATGADLGEYAPVPEGAVVETCARHRLRAVA